MMIASNYHISGAGVGIVQPVTRLLTARRFVEFGFLIHCTYRWCIRKH